VWAVCPLFSMQHGTVDAETQDKGCRSALNQKSAIENRQSHTDAMPLARVFVEKTVLPENLSIFRKNWIGHCVLVLCNTPWRFPVPSI
jgi:hypothetical protein